MLNKTFVRVILIVTCLLPFQSAFAQSTSSGMSDGLFSGLVGLFLIIALALLAMVADRLLRVSAEQSGLNDESYSLYPKIADIFGNKAEAPAYLKGEKVTHLKKGFDISIKGEATKEIETATVSTYAIKPTDFIGIAPIPKLTVQQGDTVKAGDALFFDKRTPDMMFAAPVSGEVIEVRRGEKRAIDSVVILADKEIAYRSYDLPNLDTASREELVSFLADSGIFPLIRQRPYNVIANMNETPINIFVSTFDTAPLAPDSNFVVAGKDAAFQKGIDVLAKLTSGDVHLGLNANGATPPSSVFTNVTNAKKHWFSGIHPAGNVGVQIHYIAPINANDIVWTLGIQDVITIGTLFTEGKYDVSRVVAITGDEVESAKYVQTYQGANIGNLVKVTNDHVRYISGDVLSGLQVDTAGFLSFFDDQITVVEEGDYYEPFGWLIPLKPRPSASSAFPTFAYPAKMKANTNTHGEKRAFVMTGQYEQVLPMDVLPQHLLKAILANDYERMEGLGIYELVEEDLALCEFACTSKQPVQSILRRGLDMMREQG